MTPQAPLKTTEEQLTYGAYLRVADLIKLQQPQSNLSGKAHHDELLFIIIHQTYELWFKQLLHELDAVCANLKSAAAVATTQAEHHDAVYEAARLLRRCTEIMRVLVEQFTQYRLTHLEAFARQIDLVASKGAEGPKQMGEVARGLAREYRSDVAKSAEQLSNKLLVPITLYIFVPFMLAIFIPLFASVFQSFGSR